MHDTDMVDLVFCGGLSIAVTGDERKGLEFALCFNS